MSSRTVTSATLSVLEELGPAGSLAVQEIVERVQQRLAGGGRTPKANEVRGRLTRLRTEGVVTKPARGRYALVWTEPRESDQLAVLADAVARVIRPDRLGRTVLWDATPYLALSEDGGPGVRLVVEQAQASSLREEVEAAWPDREPLVTWVGRTAGPLGRLLWEPDEVAPYRIPRGVLFVEREKLGATGLTERGYRSPFPERIMMEFLGLEGPAEAAPVVQNLLDDPTTDPRRLGQAAEALGVVADLRALLAGRLDRLRPEVRERFIGGLPPVVANLIGSRP